MNPMVHARVFKAAAWVIALAAAAVFGYTAYLHVRQGNYNILNWERQYQVVLGVSLLALLVSSRLSMRSLKITTRSEMADGRERPEPGQLHPRLKVYEEKRAPAPPPPPPQPAPPDFEIQLKKLHELKEAGIITEEEFAGKKQEILSNIK